jgi:hypothetical protein
MFLKEFRKIVFGNATDYVIIDFNRYTIRTFSETEGGG